MDVEARPGTARTAAQAFIPTKSGTAIGRAITGVFCIGVPELPPPVAKARPPRATTKKTMSRKTTAATIQSPFRLLFGGALCDETTLAGPRGGEAARVALAEHLGRRDSVRLRLGEIGLELRGHFLGEAGRHSEPLPLPPALLDVRIHHATSASIDASTESTSPRTSRHARTPSASALRPLGEAR